MINFKTYISEIMDNDLISKDLAIETDIPNYTEIIAKIEDKYDVHYGEHPKMGTHDYYLTIKDDNSFIVNIVLDQIEETIENNAIELFQVENVFKSKKYSNNKTIVTEFYVWLIKNKIKYLKSGDSQTKGSKNVWKNLINSNDINVVVVDENSGDAFTAEIDNGKIIAKELSGNNILSNEDDFYLVASLDKIL